MSLYETKAALQRIAEATAVLRAEQEAAEAENKRPVFRCHEQARGHEMGIASVNLGGPSPSGVMVTVGNLYLAPEDAVKLGKWLIDVCSWG